MDLKQVREEIDAIDEQMVCAFERRMHLVEEVAKIKKRDHLPVYQGNREEEIVLKRSRQLKDATLIPYYQQFLHQLFLLSKQRQAAFLSASTCGVFGEKGSFTESVAKKNYPDISDFGYYSSFSRLLLALQAKEVDTIFLPFENSTTGEIGEVFDLLEADHQCFITAWFEKRIEQQLLGVKGSSLDVLTTVLSHPQAISQCSLFLSQHAWTLKPVASTAEAARIVQEQNDPTCAAIASKDAKETYGLTVLADNITDDTENATRFFRLERTPLTSGAYHLLFVTASHQVGALSSIVSMISQEGWNMEDLRSRKKKGEPWSVYFSIVLKGDANQSVEKLKAKLQNVCTKIEYKGCFDKFETN